MRTLVTGAAGQLGRATRLALEERGWPCVALTRAELDVADQDAVGPALAEHRPELIVHAASWTDVDGAETETEAARRINEDGPRNLARAAAALDVPPRLISVSTDFVFDGEADRPYVESDPTGPVQAYGETKLAGERAALAAHPDGTWVVRTAWLYDAGEANFPALIRRLAADRDRIRVVEDQTGSPTFAGHLAPALLDLVATCPPDVYHLAGSGGATRREWAEAVIDACGLSCVVDPATSDEFPTPARRPRYSVLGTEHADAPRLPPWREGVSACFVGYGA